MKDNLPIGVFDSGIGGLSVLGEMIKLLPNEKYIYFGDTLRAPYGEKTPKTIVEYAKQICEFLVSKNVKAIVTACNTESAYALSDMKKWLDIPVMGVIDAAVTEALLKTKNGNIGVIATQATVNSKAYTNALKLYDKNINVIEQACPKFVPFIEAQRTKDKGFKQIIIDSLNGILCENIDTLILGCTHYPFIENEIKEVMGADIVLINPAKNTAINLKKILNECDICSKVKESDNEYYSSKYSDFMQEIVNRLEKKHMDIELKIL